MKHLLFLSLLLISVVSMSSCFKRIDAGHTGIKFNYYGITESKGVSDHEIVSGVVFYNPFTRGVFEYPHYWQDAEYEEISFNSLEGEPIFTDLKVVFRYKKDNISDVFDEYRQSPKDLEGSIIESLVLESLSTEAGRLSAVDIMGLKRDELLKNVTSSLNESYGDRFEFDLVTFTSKLIPSKNVENAIQSVIQAQEKAKSAQAATVEVQEAALQKIIRARADSSATVISAAGTAREIELVQRQLSKSPQYIEYIKAERWDGKLPSVTGGVTPFISIK